MLPMFLSGEFAYAARRALYTVAICDGEIDSRERLMLSLPEELGESNAPLEVISPEELKERITDPSMRRALVQRLVLMSALDEKIRAEELAAVRSFAQALQIDEPGLTQLELLAKGRIRSLFFDLMRKGFLGKQFKKEWQERGLRGLWTMARAAKGDKALAARYQALEQLPKESLGHNLFLHFRSNKFALPGEEGAAPELLLFHDLGHVLAGYTTDPAGEVQMAGFEAGYMKEDGFSAVMLGLVLFHYGVCLPGFVATPTKGLFELPRFQAAYQRGLMLKQDLRNVSFWEYAKLPLAQVKTSLGLS